MKLILFCSSRQQAVCSTCIPTGSPSHGPLALALGQGTSMAPRCVGARAPVWPPTEPSRSAWISTVPAARTTQFLAGDEAHLAAGRKRSDAPRSRVRRMELFVEGAGGAPRRDESRAGRRQAHEKAPGVVAAGLFLTGPPYPLVVLRIGVVHDLHGR